MIRIFKVFVPTSVLALFLSEVLVITACFVASTYITGDAEFVLLYDSGMIRISLVVSLIVLGLYFANLYEVVRIRSRLLLFQQLCLILGLSFILESLLSYWNPDMVVPIEVMILGSAFTVAALLGWRLLFSIALRNAVGARRVLFLGISPTVVQLAEHLSQHPEFGLVPIGYLDRENAYASNLPRLGSASDLMGVIDELQPHWIVIGNRAEIHPRSVDEFLELRFGGIQAGDAATLYETTCGRVCASEIRPSELLYSEKLLPRHSSLNLQSIYSTGFAFAAVIFTLPLMVLAAVLLKASSSGPVLLKQQRVGAHGALFTMYRFRWMSDRDGIQCSTSIGKLLRRFRLDALPELFNVLRGEMSVVGPRADRPEFAKRLNQIIPFYQQRQMVKPGMTGWAQIANQPSGLVNDVIHKLECDLYYIKNLSPSLDLFVLLRSARRNRS